MRGGYKNVKKNGGANMDVLVAVGTSAAYFYSIYQMVRWLNGSSNATAFTLQTSA